MFRPLFFLRCAGLLVCLVAAVTTAVELLLTGAPNRTFGCFMEWLAVMAHWQRPAIAALEVGFIAIFAAVFWIQTREEQFSHPGSSTITLLVLQMLLAVLTAPELLMIVSIEVGLFLTLRRGLVWIAVQSIVQAGAFYAQTAITGDNPLLRLMNAGPDRLPMAMLAVTAASIVWHLLAYGMGRFGALERAQGRELARLNAELRATQQLEADNARFAERLNLSRELHDSAGHHLAALSVNLRLMRHLTVRAELDAKLDESLVVVHQLLTEVRSVVRDLRDLHAIDLASAIRTLAEGVPGLKIHLKLCEELAEATPYHAHGLFRCVQEILTNVVKHSGARNLWIELRRVEAGFQLIARDDGRGVSSFQFGHGLTGMRERAIELGGNFSARSRIGEGFTVALELPVRVRAA